MANLPNPQSYEQLLADMLSAYAAKMGIDDYNVGSAVTSLYEVVALTTARSSGDIFQILRDFSVDRATGDALKRLAVENKVALISAKPATGGIVVTDTSFQKISTKIYAGAAAPNIGSTQLKISDGSFMPGTGSIYIGRGTPNVEGPIPYTSVVPSGGYYLINLSNPTTKFHNIGETVILSQGGNRSVPANTIVLAPASGASPDIQFLITSSAVILDGETQASNIPVSAITPGTDGNVPRGAIKSFAAAPFSGASVTNELPYTTGKDTETDNELRIRIKRQLASKGLGTATAIKSAVIGATPSDEQSTIVSSEIVNDTAGSIVIVDDGNGYEAKSSGVGLEAIVDLALGGEQFFQLATGGRQAPIAKAFLQSTLAAPFDLIGGDTLAITIGETTYQHIFADADFRSPGGATAFEVSASVNANTDIEFEATTAGGGVYVVFRAKEEGNDSVKVATPTTNGRDAAAQLGLPANEIQTLRLYKNKLPLSKDGKSASVFTQGQQLWSSTMVTGDTLILSVDGTSAITYTITDGDFIATGLYTSVSNTNSLESWLQVLNAKLTGVTVSIVGQQLKVTSNLGAANRAQVSISPSSTLVTKGMFSSSLGLSAEGKASDFTLFRNSAQFKLAMPLEISDELTGGSAQTEARIESAQISGGSITFASDAHIWILIDSEGEIIPTGVAGNTTLSVAKPSANVIRFGSNVANAFANVAVGDYVIIWSQELVSADRLEGRVYAKTSTTIDLLVTPTEYAAAVTTAGVLFSEGLVVLRSDSVPQKFQVASGTKNLDVISQELQAQTDGLLFSVLQDQYLVMRSRTKEINGSILIVTADGQGKLLNFPANSSDTSKDSLIAFYDSQEKESTFPLFLHAGFASGTAADPIDSYISSLTSSVSLSAVDPIALMAFLHPYGGIDDAQPYGEHIQQSSISGAVVGITENPNVRRVRSVDRYFLANPLDFGHQDTAVVVMDNDTTSKSFEIPFYRKAKTNTNFASNTTSFNAYDVDSGATANFAPVFGSTFDFSNYKAMMQAKKVLKATGVAQTGILYRAVVWGRSGEKINVGYTYPSVPNSAISHIVQISDKVDVRINLKSGAAVPSSIDSTTEWNVTITPNTPVAGVDQVTYTWSGTGTSPALGLSGGEYVNITSQGEFSEENIGIFRVSTQGGFTPTATSFSVQRPNGAAVAETNKATTVASAITFYNQSNTTAAEMVTYTTASLSDYLTATLVNDGGLLGTGVLTYSTYEDTSFVDESVYLKDGLNWIASSNLSGSPQFVFKKALDLPTDTGYAFNNGEEVRLIPTTMEQVKLFASILAVSGITTVSDIGTVERSSKLEISTDVLGSAGSVQIIGGLANQYEVPVLDSAIRFSNEYAIISTDKVSAQGIHSDQWFKLEANLSQKKDMLLSSNSSITVLANDPVFGQATIKLSGRELTQRYFGKPRHHIRVRGNKFRVEKQGSLVCLSWDGIGSSPAFKKSAVNFNASAGGRLNVGVIAGTNDAQILMLTGNGNFNELSIGDLATIAGLPVSANNGTFLVTGVSDDGKTLRVLNENAVNELSKGSFTLTTNLSPGDQVTIGAFNLIADTDFGVGATANDTAANLSAVAGTLSGITSTVLVNVVTITSTIFGQSAALSFTGAGTVAVAQMVGDSYTNSTFAASTEVAEGDTVVVSSPFALLNQGQYRVVRRYNDSIWFENPNAVEEEITLTSNYISLGFDATTSLKVNATNHSLYLNWNGVGTEPSLQNAQVGDIMNFGTDFAVANQGEFVVINSGVKLQEITNLVMPTGAQFTLSAPGQYFFIKSAGDINNYYVWFNVNGTNTDPAPGGTGLQVNILSGDNATQVATKAAAVVNVATGLDAVSSGVILTVTTTGYQETTDASNGTMPAPFSVDVTQQGRRTFIECVNPSATNESAVFVSNVLTCNRPQLVFYEYEASVPGDNFIVTGDILTTANAGSYALVKVLNRDTAIVTGAMASVSNISLNGRETAAYMSEGVPYTGYKKVLLTTSQFGAPSRTNVVFDTNAQYEKINESASLNMMSLNKLNFQTVIRKGIDAYRYNTGLLAEANRIIYGDPRDEATYPGVGAAGAEIFVREPLVRRIQVSVDVRINTGVPFAQIAEQIRTSVSSLINSNNVGQSIAISSIISAVNSIVGVKAIAISSPQYDSTHDIIKLSPSEKAKIIDPTTDVSVSQIGS